MRRIILWVSVLVFVPAQPAFSATHKPHVSHALVHDLIDYSSFHAGGLTFTMPPKWVAVPAETPARVGQWRILPPRGSTGEGGQLIAFFFGPGRGGSAKQTMAAWIGTMFNAEGHPAAAEVKNHQATSGKISQVVVFGMYSQPVPIPGVPPVSKPDYGLIGTVLENPQGNIYWRFTGPERLITANIALYNKMIDSVKREAR